MAESSPSENLTNQSPLPLLVSTRNAHKIGEIRAILGPGFVVSDLSVIPDMPEVDETGTTFEENATLKAVAASMLFEGWVIADDSGIEADALGGAPGVYSARYAGVKATDTENTAKLLADLGDNPDRTGRFRCVIVLARAGRKLAAFSGAIEGTILKATTGEGGFGYDPIFVPEGHTESFAQLPATTKNALSHRGRALEKLREWRGWF